MKKILILVGKVTEKNDKLAKHIAGFTDSEIEVKMDLFSNLAIDLEEGGVVVKISGMTPSYLFSPVFWRIVLITFT